MYSTWKVARYSITSVGHGSDPGFLAVSAQVTLVINPSLGCRYFPSGPLLLFQPIYTPHNPVKSWLCAPHRLGLLCVVMISTVGYYMSQKYRERWNCQLAAMTGIPKQSSIDNVKGLKNRKLKRSLGHYDQGRAGKLNFWAHFPTKLFKNALLSFR